MESSQLIKIKAKLLEPYVPILKKYFGFPFVEIELEIEAAKMDDEHSDEHKLEFRMYVAPEEVKKLLDSNFGEDTVKGTVVDTLFLVANLYYGDSVSDYEAQMKYEFLQEMAEEKIRKEIAQLYSFIYTRAKQNRSSDENGIDIQPIKLVSDKEKLVLDDTCGWLEALLKNHLFPNCIPEVKSDEDARNFWDKKRKAGRPSRPQVNAIVNGVATYLRDEGVVETVAPNNLCAFILDYLKVMDLMDGFTDEILTDLERVKVQIHHLAESGPVFFNYEMLSPTKEEMSTLPPNKKAYEWLFPRKQDKTEES